MHQQGVAWLSRIGSKRSAHSSALCACKRPLKVSGEMISPLGHLDPNFRPSRLRPSHWRSPRPGLWYVATGDVAVPGQRLAVPVPANVAVPAGDAWHVALPTAGSLLEVVLEVADCLEQAIPMTQRPDPQIFLQAPEPDISTFG